MTASRPWTPLRRTSPCRWQHPTLSDPNMHPGRTGWNRVRMEARSACGRPLNGRRRNGRNGEDRKRRLWHLRPLTYVGSSWKGRPEWSPPGCFPDSRKRLGSSRSETGTSAGGRPPPPPMAAAWVRPYERRPTRLPGSLRSRGTRAGPAGGRCAPCTLASSRAWLQRGVLELCARRGDLNGRPPVACLLADVVLDPRD